MPAILFRPQSTKSLWPSDAIWWHRYGSTLAHVMACCLTAPSHYLNQCWPIVNMVQWHSSEGNFTKDTSATNLWISLKTYLSKISIKSPRGQWVKFQSKWNQNPVPDSSSTSSTSIPKRMVKALLAALVLASFLVLPTPCGKGRSLILHTDANFAVMDGLCKTTMSLYMICINGLCKTALSPVGLQWSYCSLDCAR